VVRLTTKPKVICFSGSIASGKSSLIEKIEGLLGETAVIKFDDYGQFNKYPEDFPKRIKEGADATLIKNQRMLDDIHNLIVGESVVNPLTDEKIPSANFILVEDPFGPLRDEFAQLYDFLVFIEIPPDISLARLIKRIINEATSNGEEDAQANIAQEDFKKLINQISSFLNIYLEFQRDLFLIICSKVKPHSDLLLDGQNSLDVLANKVVMKIND